MANYRVQFEGKLIGRALNTLEQVTGVVLGDLTIDGKPIQHRNALCTPARAFDQIASFEKARIVGNAEYRRNDRGEIRLSDCKWIELVDPPGLLPEPEPHAHMQRVGETTDSGFGPFYRK